MRQLYSLFPASPWYGAPLGWGSRASDRHAAAERHSMACQGGGPDGTHGSATHTPALPCQRLARSVPPPCPRGARPSPRPSSRLGGFALRARFVDLRPLPVAASTRPAWSPGFV